MSLIKCPECGKEVSTQATTCPNCGCPVPKTIKTTATTAHRLTNEEFEKRRHKENLTIIAFALGIPLLIIFAFVYATSNITYNNSNNVSIDSDIETIENNDKSNNESNSIPLEETTGAEDIRNNFIESCESYPYKDIARNPNDYINKNVKFKGRVVQASESQGIFSSTKSVSLLIAVTESTYGYYDDNIYCTYTYSNGESKILEDDIITIYGVCKGDYTYTSVLSAQITVPKVELKYFTIEE